MRYRLLPLLVLPAMVLLAPACMGQARDPEPVAPAKTDVDATAPRSAFGQVIQVMIDALQQDVRRNAGIGTAREVRTTASGTPLGIEVGGAFRLDSASAVDAGRPLAVQDADGPGG